jgi:UDP-2,3-diacylglucosamine pyrophosphatase LpxH
MELTQESDKVPAELEFLTASDGHDVQQTPPAPYRTVFISDVHLGAKTCQADRLLAFLRDLEADVIYLVGDIVDGWQLKTGWYWPQPHNDVVQKLLRKARKGTRLIYVPGNHDEFLRNYFGTHFGGIEVVADAVHVAADGRRYLVTHGDRFDLVVKHARWLSLFGDQANVLAMTINKVTNWFRRRFGLGYWSLSGWAKLKLKKAVNYIGDFEQALAAEARRHRCDGVICGHIHHPANRDIAGVHYINCGDWIESCTVVVETLNGGLEILWTPPQELLPVSQQARAA